MSHGNGDNQCAPHKQQNVTLCELGINLRRGRLPENAADQRQVMVVVIGNEKTEVDQSHRLFQSRMEGGAASVGSIQPVESLDEEVALQAKAAE